MKNNNGIPFHVARELINIISKFKSPKSMGDILSFLELQNILKNVLQQEENKKLEVFELNGVHPGEVIQPSDPRYAKVVSDLSEIRHSTIELEEIARYGEEELWYHIEENLNLYESGLIMEYLKKK